MKTKISYSLLAAAMACGLAYGQTTAYTTPVGYVSLGDTTTGQPAVKANTDVWISIPLAKSPIFAGPISSVVGSTINLAGSPALGDLLLVPHTVTIQTGVGEGIVAMITANTANSVTISVPPGDSLAGVVSPDQVKIAPAWTVVGLLGTSLGIGTTLFTYPSTSALNPSSEGIYDFDGINWIDSVNTGAAADNDILFPGETLVLRNGTNTPIPSLVITGEVPTANSRIVVSANGASGADNAISYFSPVGESIGNSSLSAFAQTGDTLFGFDNNAPGINKSSSSIHDYDNGDWIDSVNSGSADNEFPLGVGQGFILRRNGVRTQAIWSDKQSFRPLP